MKEISERPICHRAEDLVTFLYEEGSSAEARDFADHAAQCDACRSELAVFRGVHESILTWRNEALGVAFKPASQTSATVTELAANPTVIQRPAKLSGLSALREFFNVSPLWLRGATVFAALLLCVLGVLTVARFLPGRVDKNAKVNNDQMYTRQQVDDEVKNAVAQKETELTNKQNSRAPADYLSGIKSNNAGNRNQLVVNHQPRAPRQKVLSREERQQLAADLRLTSPVDEEETSFILPEQENPNR